MNKVKLERGGKAAGRACFSLLALDVEVAEDSAAHMV